jgi:HEAT repeat protein
MASIFERLWKLGPAAFVVKAIIAAIVADGLLVAFILLRRTYRKRYFAMRDVRVFEWRQRWDDLISGTIPSEQWRKRPFDRAIIESMALDAFEVATPKEAARLLNFLRENGLIEKRIFEARRFAGWRRMRALVALGRTRAPEGIAALAEGLRDRNREVRLAALRGLGRMACPQAAEEILAWVGETGLSVPAMPLQSALIQCCGERPQLLVPYVRHTEGPLREVLGRVLGEVATPSVGMDLLQFVEDDLAELRSAAARGMSQAKSGLAFDVLNKLALDPVWFVRLRAMVSLGKLRDDRAISALIRGLTDSNRLVRLRAAEALVDLNTGFASIFLQVVETRDRYGLHAYLTALENADCRGKLEEELQSNTEIGCEEKTRLLKVLQTGALPVGEPEHAPVEAPSVP